MKDLIKYCLCFGAFGSISSALLKFFKPVQALAFFHDIHADIYAPDKRLSLLLTDFQTGNLTRQLLGMTAAVQFVIGIGCLRALWDGSATEKKRMAGVLSFSYLLSGIFEVISPTFLAIEEHVQVDVKKIMESPPNLFVDLAEFVNIDALVPHIPRTVSFWATIILAGVTAFSVSQYTENNSSKRSVIIPYSEAERKQRMIDVLNLRIPKVVHVKEKENPLQELKKAQGIFQNQIPKWPMEK